MSNLKIGDRVKISVNSIYWSWSEDKVRKWDYGNPSNFVGTIVSVEEYKNFTENFLGKNGVVVSPEEENDWWYVFWDNNTLNSYPKEGDHLILAE
jgi:hypothetical protein